MNTRLKQSVPSYHPGCTTLRRASCGFSKRDAESGDTGRRAFFALKSAMLAASVLMMIKYTRGRTLYRLGYYAAASTYSRMSFSKSGVIFISEMDERKSMASSTVETRISLSKYLRYRFIVSKVSLCFRCIPILSTWQYADKIQDYISLVSYNLYCSKKPVLQQQTISVWKKNNQKINNKKTYINNKSLMTEAYYLLVSGKRDSDPRPQPWQGCALPTELFPQNK